MTRPSSRLVDRSFPAELVLEIIQHLELGDGTVLAKLQRIHPRISNIIKLHERSVTSHFVRTAALHAPTDFPCDEANFGFKWLHQCIKSYDIIDNIMSILNSPRNCHRPKDHCSGLINIGFFLLCQLVSIEPHASKLAFLHTLPHDPLTAIFLALHYSMLTARYNAVGIMHQRIFGYFMDASLLSYRHDVELSFCEAVLGAGPAFVHDMIVPAAGNAERADVVLLNFFHDYARREWDVGGLGGLGGSSSSGGGGISSDLPYEFRPLVTRGAEREVRARGASLYAGLRGRLAAVAGVGVEEVEGWVLDEMEHPGNPLAWITNRERERLVRGLDVE